MKDEGEGSKICVKEEALVFEGLLVLSGDGQYFYSPFMNLRDTVCTNSNGNIMATNIYTVVAEPECDAVLGCSSPRSFLKI